MPSDVIRICHATDFRVTDDSYGTHLDQIEELGPTFLCLIGCEETPIMVTNGSEITVLNPLGLFMWVPSFSPFPEIIEDAGINIAEGFLGACMTVIIGPTPDYRVEHPQHLRCCTAKMRFNDFSGFGNNAFY